MSFAHVYHLNASLFQQLEASYFACLHAADWVRVRSLKRQADQQIRQLAYATLYKLWRAHNPSATKPASVRHDSLGKPFIVQQAEHEPWHFNLSHSGQQIAIAFASSPVGIDIEYQRDVEVKTLAAHYFKNEPWVSHSLATFYQAWVCKEALLKAKGIGLRVDPTLITLHPPSRRYAPVKSAPSELELASYQYALIDSPKRYACAIACEGTTPTVQSHTLGLAQLLAL